MKTKFTKTKLYKILAYLTIIILAIGFTFPLYWIITGSFKTPQAINATTPQWFPQEWTLANYEKLLQTGSPIMGNPRSIYGYCICRT